MPATATYLYCIVKSTAAPSLARVPGGVPGASRPALLPVGRSLRLVLAEVPLDVYGSGPLERALADLPWVSDVALAHEAVVEHFIHARGAAVIPMKLFTMFSSAERAAADVASRKAEIQRLFTRIAGCAEWGVRVRRRAAPTKPARRGARAASGAAFLAARKQARDQAREAAMAAAEAAEDGYAALARIAHASRRRDAEPNGAVTPPLVDAAFLVRTANLPRFKAAARRAAAACAAAGAEMTLTGPWPAYNFVQLESGR